MERLKHVNRIDVVFDRCDPESLKTNTRNARGTGQKILVTHAARFQSNSRNFLPSTRIKSLYSISWQMTWCKKHGITKSLLPLMRHLFNFSIIQSLTLHDKTISDDLQRFVCLMYDRTTTTSTVNDCRQILFTKKIELFKIFHQLLLRVYNIQNDQHCKHSFGTSASNVLL